MGFLQLGLVFHYNSYNSNSLGVTLIKKQIVNYSTLTCPYCHRQSRAFMPTNACAIVWNCPQCQNELKPKAGDCCVFCSYGDTPCPPIQQARS